MYKVLLVDDEPNVRQGIKMMIPWEDIDCEVIGEGDDGDDGLSKIMTLNPDIVIADIKMPGKTGIEMTDAAKSLGFKGKVIILSGYSDFTYAKTAIALGVENFILKPVDEDELIEAIKSAAEKIERENIHSFNQKIGKEYLNEQLVRGLFSGNPVQIAEVADTYLYNEYCAAVIECTSQSDAGFNAMKYVKSILGSVNNVDIVPVDINSVIGILFKGWKKNEIEKALQRISDGAGGKIFISCGPLVSIPAEICRSFEFARNIYEKRFIFSHCGIVTPDNIYSGPEADPVEYAAKIYAYMEINDTDKLDEILDSFMASMHTAENTPEKAKISCITMLMDVRSRIVRSVSDKKPENMITDMFISEVGDMASLKEMINAIKTVFRSISDKCYGKTTKSTMEKVVQYIHANYNTELRLENLAVIFGYNSAYLGKVFHQYTGENFNNYLDSIRIAEAKRLLEDGEYKVYEVAEMVGYSNINYFHNKFKRYVGISPLSYKKNRK